MAETTAPPPSIDRAAEEAGFYHEAALNATWTGIRLALGGMSFLFGAFLFTYFYLRSLNPYHMWHPTGFKGPQQWAGAVVMALVVASALVQWAAVLRIKAGNKRAWQMGALVAMVLGLAAVAIQLWQLVNLPFYPGSAGFASTFVGYTPVFVIIAVCALIWLEMLLARSTKIPEISFVEQPPTYAEAFAVQRFQASLSAFTLTWLYLAAVAILFWILFYLVV
jgi:heme/copper-type cytochrome/quinol oxidase subunit 3